ncbi:MAG: NPCBM/NEW2 domain-containing protein [Pirellulales bacterium]
MHSKPSVLLVAIGLIGLTVTSFSAHAAEPSMIENETLQVTFDSAKSCFAVRGKAAGNVFVTGGQLAGTGGTVRVAPAVDATFGTGQAIEIAYPNGNRDAILLFPKLPFVLFRATLHNGGAEATVTNHLRTVAAGLDLGKPLEDVRAFGTGGLMPPEKNPGSYAFLAVVDPARRAGVVGGWLTQDRGSGVVFSPVEDGQARMVAQLDYGRLRIKPGHDVQTETFALGWFDDARLGLEAYADAIAKVYAIKLPPQPAGYCTWYADKYGGACDEKHLAELAAFAAGRLKPFGFDFVQIDDSWQAGVSKNGPKRNFTTHRPDGPYPAGMKAAADGIKQLGLKPGIWFMPFAGTYYDPFFRDHQEWFARTADGKPFETDWGGTCMDMTQPGAREHLRGLVERFSHQWGYQVFKMDGLWTGTATRQMYVNDGYKDDQIGEAVLHDPDKTHIEAFRDGLKLVRRAAGPDVFLLGCCVAQNMRSFGGSFGLLDAMRIGPDTGAGHIGAVHGTRTYFLHGRVWQNDPDCVSVRAATPLGQAQMNATWTAISGQLFYNSDWLPDLPAQRLEILQRTMPAHGLPARPVDLFESEPARIWLLTDARRAPRRDVVALYNWDESRAATIACPVDRLGLPPAAEYVAFDFWANRFVPPFQKQLVAELPAASCRVLAVRPVAGHPQLLSTSRHVTQGIVDVSEEKWDAAARTLAGISRVVTNDPYELRIVVPTGASSWRASAANVAAADIAAGVTIELKQDGPKLRVSIRSATSREVRWSVKFEAAGVEIPAPATVTGLKAVADYGAVTLVWDDAGADRFRIVRDDGKTFEAAAATFEDASVAHGRKYRYTVEAIGWDGKASPPAAVEVSTPAELVCPPAPPAPDVYLSDLKPLRATQGWGKLAINRSVEGKPLAVEGKRYRRGLGTHAAAVLIYQIPAGARRFVSVVGLDDEKRDDPRPSVTFAVYGDVKEMGESPVLLAKSPVLSAKTIRSWAFDVPLDSRLKELQLVVTDAGDGIAADHADWVNAGFMTKAAGK